MTSLRISNGLASRASAGFNAGRGKVASFKAAIQSKGDRQGQMAVPTPCRPRPNWSNDSHQSVVAARRRLQRPRNVPKLVLAPPMSDFIPRSFRTSLSLRFSLWHGVCIACNALSRTAATADTSSQLPLRQMRASRDKVITLYAMKQHSVHLLVVYRLTAWSINNRTCSKELYECCRRR